MKNHRHWILALSSLVAASTVAAALTSPTAPVSAQAPAPVPAPNMTQLKALYSEKCSACHNLPDPVEKAYTRQEWQRTVTRMLTQYKASDSISPNEAGQIVTYLATFAPKTPRNGNRPDSAWGTESTDIWTDIPSATHVFNFEAADALVGFNSLGAGMPGPAPVWRVVSDKPGADGDVARVTAAGFTPDRFALLIDHGDQAQNLDIRVRFRIDSGKASPAVGIVFGFTDPKNYTVLRFNQSAGDMALIQIAGAAHTTLQQTPLALPLPPTPLTPPVAPVPPSPNAGVISLGGGIVLSASPLPVPDPIKPVTQGTWHTLRLLVRDGQVRGWVDMNKRISIPLPSYTGGKVGLWTQGDTAASFDDWTVDLYTPAPVTPLS